MDIDLAIIGMMAQQLSSYIPYRLRKTQTGTGWVPVAIAVGSPLMGDFELSFEAGSAGFIIVGVTENPASTDYADNKIALYPYSLTRSQVLSRDTNVGYFAYTAGDILSIRRVGAALSYKIGVGAWTSISATSSATLYAYACMYNYDLSVKNIKIGSQKPIWTLPSGIIEELI